MTVSYQVDISTSCTIYTVMAPQELIVSACGAETASTSSSRSTSAPAIHLHDLLSAAPVQSFKTSISATQSVSHVPTSRDTGGAIFAVQEGKAIANVWAWQKVCVCACSPTDM